MAARLTAYIVVGIVAATLIAGLIVGAQRDDNDGPVDIIVHGQSRDMTSHNPCRMSATNQLAALSQRLPLRSTLARIEIADHIADADGRVGLHSSSLGA